MPIQVPKERTYYQSSPAEPDRLLCWIPRRELEEMVRNGHAGQDVLEDYPRGLEIEVSEEVLKDAGIDLEIGPENIREAYALLREQGSLDKSGYVRASDLEDFAKDIDARGGFSAITTVPSDLSMRKPAMSDGEESSVVFQRLAAKRGR